MLRDVLFDARNGMLTKVGILERGIAGVEGLVDDWDHALVKVIGAVEQAQVFVAVEVVVRAGSCSTTASSSFEPTARLAASASSNNTDGDQLEAIQWTGDVGAISERLRAKDIADGWIEAL